MVELTIEEYHELNIAKENYDTQETELLEMLSVEAIVLREIDKIVNSLEQKSDTDLVLGVEEYNNTTRYLLGEEPEYIVSLEELKGSKKGLIERLVKKLTNLKDGITDSFNKLKALAGLMSKYNSKKLIYLREAIKSEKLVPLNSDDFFTVDLSSVNKKLAMYYEANNSEFDIKKLYEYLQQPYELIVKEKLYTKVCKYMVDDFIIDYTNKKAITTNEASLKFLKNIKSKTITDWIDKDTKVAIVDRFIGDKFCMTYVINNDEETDVRTDWITIPREVYSNVKDKPLSEEELLKLIDYGLLLGESFMDITKEATNGVIPKLFKNISESLPVALLKTVFTGISVKRNWKGHRMSAEFLNGVMQAMIMQNRSYKQVPDLFSEIVIKTTKKRAIKEDDE
jgi:hypothetical protein